MRRNCKKERKLRHVTVPEKPGAETINDSGKTEDEIVREVTKAFDNVIGELGFDEGMGFIARYYFLKKNDAAALRLMFAEKSVDGGAEDE